MKNSLKQIINKFNELYILARYKYLIMNNEAEYITINTYTSKKAVKLNDGIVKRHLEGKATLGVFAGQYLTKFICFDVDVSDDRMAKWTVYKLVDTLIEIGIPQDKIYISTSGNRGYHVEVFFNKPIENRYASALYSLIIKQSEIPNYNKCIEFRPTDGQGVKLPLGRNFKNKNKITNICWYVDYSKGLKPIRDMEYILSIEQIESQFIFDILQRENDSLLDEASAEDIEDAKGYIDSQYQPLDIYKQNIDESVTIESIEKLERQGLTQTGMRNNSLFKLAKYYRYLGVTREECKDMLIDWMARQDKKFYTTSWENCLKDIEHIHNYIYDNDVSMTIDQQEIEVTYHEMKQIMGLKSKNEKLIAYCMLIHSKRYSNQSGVFYMSYDQMAKVSGLGEKTTRRIVPKLEDYGIIEYIERNVMVKSDKGQFITKKPNKYKVNIDNIESNSKLFTALIDDNINYADSFNSCLLYLFNDDELKSMLSRRQYQSVVGG